MSVLQIDNNKLTNARFASVYETMRDHEDDDNAIKVADLYEKYLNNEFVICFSGHFLQENLLLLIIY